MLANRMCNNDCCITCMCIHVITVTSVRPWTQSQDVRGYIWFIPCILVSTRQECEQIEKKSGYTVKRVPLTKNRWRDPFTTAIINWFSVQLIFVLFFPFCCCLAGSLQFSLLAEKYTKLFQFPRCFSLFYK